VKLLRAALDFLFAPRANCQGCGSELGSDKDWLCASCYAKLKPLYLTTLVREELCETCGGVIRGMGRCEACGARGSLPFSAAAAYAYEPPVRQLIRGFKFHGIYRMEDWMADEMVRAYKAAGFPRCDFVQPVPMHWIRRNERGIDHAARLAKAFAARTDMPYRNVLRRARLTRQQAKQSGAARRQALADAIRAKANLRGETVLLIDDVRTTGTTVSQCRKALAEAGAGRVYVLTLARTERKERAATGEG